MKPTRWTRGAAQAALLGAVCLLSTACGQPNTAAPDAGQPVTDVGPGQPPDAGTPTRTLQGRDEVIYWAPDGTSSTRVPADTTRTFIELQVPNSSGGWDRVPGIANADGTWVVNGAPLTGDFWLRVYDPQAGVNEYLWTNDAPDLSRSARGRADAVTSHDRRTTLVFHADGLADWQDFDELYMVSGNLGLSRAVFPTYFSSNGPVNGDTKVDGLTDIWAGLPLLSSERGDDFQVVQVRTMRDPTDSFQYESPVRTVAFSGLTLTEGSQNEVTGTFAEPPAFDYHLEWKRSTFAALGSQVNPIYASAAQSNSFFVSAVAGGAEHGRIIPFEMPIIGHAYPPVGTGDLSEVLPARNPFPVSWVINGYNMSFPVGLTVGDGVSTGLNGEIGLVSTELPSAGKPVVPLISPVQNLKLGDRAIADRISGVEADPVLSWTAPELGTATSYEIHVDALQVIYDLGRPWVRVFDVAVLRVPGDLDHVKLPPDLLDDGFPHLIRVRAIHQEGQDVRHAPYALGLPFGWADSVSSAFTR